jgi:hypothetical protein
VVIDNAPHAALYSHNLARGAVVRLVMNTDSPRCAVLSAVLLPAKRRALPAAFRWVAGACCLPTDMERALEMRHCCLRLGLPEAIPLQAFYALHATGTRTLHELLTNPDTAGDDATVSAVRHWARQQALSLADVMHASGAFAPEWGKLRLALAIHASGATHSFDDVLVDTAALAPHWPIFQEFLSRHNLWAAAHEFAVLPVRAKKKRRDRKPRSGAGDKVKDKVAGEKVKAAEDKGAGGKGEGAAGKVAEVGGVAAVEPRKLSASAAMPISARAHAHLHSESDKPPPSPPDELMSAA